ncbi:MAG TPA: YHS domain-containing (seleno)protein [Stellaceae bacterium]|nr:YHS domain-containing (seleno)protein [Stellaceae bacterium]
MRPQVYRLALSGALFALGMSGLAAPGARGDEARLSISGYDPVAYFTDRQPVAGSPEFEYLWHRLRWRFASSGHRDLFAREPNRYAPQYDGFCSMGVGGNDEASAHKDTVDPKAWVIVDGKLYLAHNRYWLEKWKEKAKEHITQGDAHWPVVAKLPDPVVVGPPCATSPPTTFVALRGGGHWVVVGGQVARDAAGKLVGKEDMRAQIEQVGKNVGVCLNAVGASIKDILWTVSYVTNLDEFAKHADLRQRYFGPPSPNSATVRVPRLADPDYLVQVEAFAAIK